MNTKHFDGHTPGHWAITTRKGTWVVHTQDNGDVATVNDYEDAKLIRAAPDLLDLLKDARRMVQELHALLSRADEDEAYEWALRNIGEQEMTWWRTYYVRRS